MPLHRGLDPGSADRGLNFFAGGSSPDGLSSITQIIGVTAGATTIDSGAARRAVPEFTSAALLAAGLGALGFARRRTQRDKSAA